ncbi:hypothetical protein H5410_043306 [Solanum commersonii]|uniref:DUF4283 domain-containing protein n=1 Tax=Solanum commersonii TaxID=4109 RepID=A0A9J5XZW5_SOLCO|nr:hypothetical protein H5410_043306 [Solanum commersonii]
MFLTVDLPAPVTHLRYICNTLTHRWSLTPTFKFHFPPLPDPKYSGNSGLVRQNQKQACTNVEMGKQIPINPGLAAQRNKGMAHTSYANATVNKTVRQNQIRLETRGYEIQDGKPLVVFTKEENDLLTQTCKWTIIGNISHIRPSIDIIQKEFAKMISSKGNVKIGAYNMHHVFIDFDNVDDHLNVYSKNFLTFGETHLMKILRWTPNFKPEAETTLAPVWINLPDLPWHFYEWDAIQRICKPIGTPLIMDKATRSKTRPATAKVRIEVDLTRPLVYEVLVEIQNEEGKMEVITQKVEYETIPAFCSHCKVQGHRDEKCRKLHPELRQEPGKNTNDVGQSKNVMDNQFTDGKKAPMTNKRKMRVTIRIICLQTHLNKIMIPDLTNKRMGGKQSKEGKEEQQTTRNIKETMLCHKEFGKMHRRQKEEEFYHRRNRIVETSLNLLMCWIKWRLLKILLPQPPKERKNITQFQQGYTTKTPSIIWTRKNKNQDPQSSKQDKKKQTSEGS